MAVSQRLAFVGPLPGKTVRNSPVGGRPPLPPFLPGARIRAMRPAFLALLLGAAAFAQPRGVDVFANIGYIHLMEDEGTLGNAATYGGSAIFGFSRRFAADFDVMTAHHSRPYPEGSFRVRRTIVAPALLARWGGERAYGFAGGGAGAQIDAVESFFQSYSGMPPLPTGIVHTERTDTGLALNVKSGFVAAIAKRLVVRGDVVVVWRYVAPSIAVRGGVGYRF